MEDKSFWFHSKGKISTDILHIDIYNHTHGSVWFRGIVDSAVMLFGWATEIWNVALKEGSSKQGNTRLA